MSRKERIKELETELRLLKKEIYIINRGGSSHARHNKFYKRYVDVLAELERISIKYKFKQIIRRLKSWLK